MLKELEMAEQTRPPLAPYGDVLDDLMRDRGLRSAAELSRYLKAKGIKRGTAQQTLSYHMLGRSAPSPKLVNQIADALDATDDERSSLRNAYWDTEWGPRPCEDRGGNS